MTRHALNKWLLVMAAIAIGFGCQPKNSSASSSEKNSPQQPSCSPSVSNPGGPCEQNCREDECDEQEAGEEAMTHVIEVDDFEESSSASAKEAPQAAPEAPAEAAQAPVEQVAPEAPAQEAAQAPAQEPAVDMVQDSSPISPASEEPLSTLDVPAVDSTSETAVQQ